MTWATARRWILPALKDATEAELIADLNAGAAQLWEGVRSAFVTQVSPEPRTMHCWLAGGDLAELRSLVPGIEAHARAIGCLFASVDGRKGWERVLRPYGYEREGAELRKALS